MASAPNALNQRSCRTGVALRPLRRAAPSYAPSRALPLAPAPADQRHQHRPQGGLADLSLAVAAGTHDRLARLQDRRDHRRRLALAHDADRLPPDARAYAQTRADERRHRDKNGASRPYRP
jgi:hypothetical protein